MNLNVGIAVLSGLVLAGFLAGAVLRCLHSDRGCRREECRR